MLELSDIQSSPEELQDYYAQLRAQHITPAWIGGGISVEPRSEAVPYVWHGRAARPCPTSGTGGICGRRQCGRPSW
jgi:gentisate 1,2-dioxygenase